MIKKIRVIHLLHSFGTGGLEKGIATLVNYGSSDIEHVIVSMTSAGESIQLLPTETEVLLMDKQEGNSVGFLLDVSNRLRRLKPDVVHTRNWSGMDGILASKMAGIDNIVHGEHGWDMSDPFGSSRKRLMIRRLFSVFVKKYTCVSEQIEQWLLNDLHISQKNVHQIYNGVDSEKYRPAVQEEKKEIRMVLGVPEEDFVVGTVGRLDGIKNQTTLLKAFEIFREQTPQTWLVIAGDGRERIQLEQEAGEHVIFLGNRSDADLVLRALDLFILPSFNEGISNTILEAMATGLPVAASRVGGNPELVEDGRTGSLFDPYEKEQIAACMLKYQEDPMLVRIHGKAGRLKAQSFFSIRRMVIRYEDIYRSII